MTKPRTTRVVPITNLQTRDGGQAPEGVPVDLPTTETEQLLSLGLARLPEGDEIEASAAEPATPKATDKAG